jgi:hypothetical protein
MSETRWRRVISACFGIGVLVSGCTAVYKNGGPPMVIYSTPFGTTQVNPGGQPAPVQNPPVPTTSANRDGVYSGTAVPLDTGGGLCIKNIPVTGFRVHGDSVQWGRFRGRIENNGVQMVDGNTWVYGQFAGDEFDGQISTTARFDQPGCTFMMRLKKIGG